jgi:uncharacterized membrane protein AbrB (regulator of aidB expression)
MAIAVLTAVFFILQGTLWYLRPNPDIWLLGSLFLGILWGFGFMRLITRDSR